MEKISDLFGGQNSTTKVMKVLLQGSVDNIPPIGSIKPWMSDDDIPDGYNHLGAKGSAEASTGKRSYDPAIYPDFASFLNKQFGDSDLRLMREGEAFRQVIETLYSGQDRDATTPWAFQGDAIRPVTGSVYIAAAIGGASFSTTGDNGVLSHDALSSVAGVVPDDWTDGSPVGIKFDISKEHPVAKDVRMANRSVNWLIKVKHTKGQQDMIDTLNTL